MYAVCNGLKKSNSWVGGFSSCLRLHQGGKGGEKFSQKVQLPLHASSQLLPRRAGQARGNHPRCVPLQRRERPCKAASSSSLLWTQQGPLAATLWGSGPSSGCPAEDDHPKKKNLFFTENFFCPSIGTGAPTIKKREDTQLSPLTQGSLVL